MVQCDKCADEADAAALASRRQEEWLAAARNNANLPRKYQHITLDMLRKRNMPEKQRQALGKVTDWGRLVHDQAWLHLVLIGGTGTGKTEMQCALANALMGIGVACKYATLSDITLKIRQAWASKTAERDVISVYYDTPVLIIDELSGARASGGSEEGLSPREEALLEDLIDNRYRKNLKTVYAGNVPSRQHMEALLGPRVCSRAMDGAVVVVCDWPTWRNPAGNDDFQAAAARSNIKF
jgi:DNA replication protein DnaC